MACLSKRGALETWCSWVSSGFTRDAWTKLKSLSRDKLSSLFFPLSDEEKSSKNFTSQSYETFIFVG
jgi:hypothetical protein